MENKTVMKAVYIDRHGTLDEIKVGDLDVPKYESDEVLIKTHFAALNHLDIFVIKGWPGLRLKFPHILGADGAGIVNEIGADVTTVELGDHVLINPSISCGKCAMCLSGEQNYCSRFSIKGEHFSGTFAEYFSMPEVNLMKIPKGFPMDKASTSLTFLTSWSMLVTKARIKYGDFVFIQGGSGGVSTCSIQIAKYFGATVITSTSTEAKVKKLKEIGADYVINYTEMPDYAGTVFKELTKRHGIDIVVDSVGSATFIRSQRMLRSGGKLVICGATTGPKAEIDLSSVFWKQLEILGSTMSNQQEFRDVMQLVLEGKLVPVIDKIFPLEQANEAEKYLESSNHVGKILLRI